MNILLEYCMPFVRNGGRFLAMKGAAEEEPYENALRELKGEVESEDRFTLPQSEFTRRIVCIKKNGFLSTAIRAAPGFHGRNRCNSSKSSKMRQRSVPRVEGKAGPEGVETFIFR